MNELFSGQVAVITGAASGLGLAIAQKLLSQSVKLALFDKDISLLKKALVNTEHAMLYETDVTDETAVAMAVEAVYGHYGTIDILINCAGITGVTNIKSHETDTANAAAVFAVNYWGAYFTSKHVLRIMLKANYGRILHIASVAGKEGNAGMLAYSASKAAVIGMTKVQGKEYAETGITVNALAPAVIRTALVDQMPEAQVKYMTDKIPMKRCGTLDEFADMSMFIVSPQNSFTTGFTFDLTGGRATY
ncbi:SDR family oxidoreductase [Panacibacter sp. DH6]|uniref:SDR family oxidoreductase n=1 Tax=Panacibacter microcysteis TaxID=2793269 RepID=A0A931E8U3_9BACT|nr:SDR family NAD(P)-dependent oxidoreductase [Panacibacter microcysteis]MBG9377420.1 SDR family oxidoreductase [Panacibacter microcysteis]